MGKKRLAEQIADANRVPLNDEKAIEAIVEEFEGYRGLARKMAMDYQALDAGHGNRIKILTTIFNAIVKRQEPVEEETEDLDQLRNKLAKVLKGLPAEQRAALLEACDDDSDDDDG